MGADISVAMSTAMSADMGTALVTGGARRIGAAICRGLAADGWRVLIHCNTSLAEAGNLASELRNSGCTADTVTCDLSDARAVDALIPRCVEIAGPVKLLVNNAAMFEPDWLDDISEDGWQAHIDVNLRAPVMLMKHFAAALPESATGCVVNILDNKVVSPNPDYFSYSIAKYALKGATEMAAMAMAPRIRVCGVAPGLTVLSGDQTPEAFGRDARRNLLSEPSSPEEVANAVRYVASARMFNGQVLIIDGGQTLMRLPRDVAFLGESSDGESSDGESSDG